MHDAQPKKILFLIYNKNCTFLTIKMISENLVSDLNCEGM